jgi:hypothetical protein
MLYVVPEPVIEGIFTGLFCLFLFAGIVALSAKTGYVMNSPYTSRKISRSSLKLYNDYAKLHRFSYCLLITAAVTTVLGLALYGFDMVYIGAAVVWAVFVTAPAAIPYWCVLILKVKDKQ